MKGLSVLAAVVLLASCSGADVSAAACEEWSAAVADEHDGVLTDEEWRARLIEVADMAEGSQVEDPARQVLAAVTAGELAPKHIRAMTQACYPDA